MNFSNQKRWQEITDRLDETSFCSAIKRQHWIQLLGWLMCGASAGLVALFLIYLYQEMHILKLGWLLLCLAAAVGSVCLFISELRKKSGEESRIFQKYGEVSEVLSALKRGAEHIEIETKRFVMTDTYVIDKTCYANYVPYSAIASFTVDHGTLGVVTTQSSAVYHLVVKDQSGDEMRFQLEQNEHHLIAEMQHLIRRYAPQAVFGR